MCVYSIIYTLCFRVGLLSWVTHTLAESYISDYPHDVTCCHFSSNSHKYLR